MSRKYTYFDGKKAHQYLVKIKLTTNSIVGINDNEEIIFEWEFKTIQVIEHPSSENKGIVTQTKSTERLILDEDLFAEVIHKIKNKKHLANKLNTSTKSLFGWGIIAILMSLLFYQIITFSSVRLINYIPKSIETMLNEEAKALILYNHKVCSSPKSEELLNKILMHLKTNTTDIDEIKITIINKNEINAVALPGNEIIIYSELLQCANNPSEIAGVLAHEIAHIEKKHVMKAIIQKLGIRIFLNSILQTTIDLSFLFDLSYSRKVEEEADSFALKILEENNINPNALANFFEKNKTDNSNSNSKILNYFSTHPSTSERITKFKSNREEKEYTKILTLEEFKLLQNICIETFTN